MITLTLSQTVKSQLGGAATVAYDKLVLSTFSMDAVNQTVSGNVRLTSTSAPTMQSIIGTFKISVPSAEFIIEVPQLDFYRRLVLTSAQNNAILANIETAQKALEDGIVTLDR